MTDLKKVMNGRKKQVLVTACVASMLDNFNRSNIRLLLEMGFEVTLAANFKTDEDINSQEKIDGFVKEMRKAGVHIVQIDFSRKIRNVRRQVVAARQVKKLLRRRFDIVHCHSPICAAVTRAAFQKYRKNYGGKIIYTAHGFHFYQGAPLKNWILYYPVEAFLSRWTDVLITINHEDFWRAKRKFYAGRVIYVPGIGVDTKKLGTLHTNVLDKRKEIGLGGDDVILLSVGELNENKNHELVIRAFARLRDQGRCRECFSKFHYIICGQGEKKEYLEKMVHELWLDGQVHLLGYRDDAAEIIGCADVFAFMSKREGLPVSLMEEMACGLPSVCSKIRGNIDLVRHGQEGYIAPFDEAGLADYLDELFMNKEKREQMGISAKKRMKFFDILKVSKTTRKIYEGDL